MRKMLKLSTLFAATSTALHAKEGALHHKKSKRLTGFIIESQSFWKTKDSKSKYVNRAFHVYIVEERIPSRFVVHNFCCLKLVSLFSMATHTRRKAQWTDSLYPPIPNSSSSAVSSHDIKLAYFLWHPVEENVFRGYL